MFKTSTGTMKSTTINTVSRISEFYSDPARAFEIIMEAVRKKNPTVSTKDGEILQGFVDQEVADFEKHSHRPASVESLEIRLSPENEKDPGNDSPITTCSGNGVCCEECVRKEGVVRCRNHRCQCHHPQINADIRDGFDRQYNGDYEEPEFIEAPTIVIR